MKFVFFLDTTCLCRAEVFDHPLFSKWVEEGVAPAIPAMLSLYKVLQAENWGIVFMTGRTESQRNITSQNLLDVGYSGWTTLLLRYVVTCHSKSYRHFLNFNLQYAIMNADFHY